MTREEAIKIIDCYDIGFYDLSGEKIPADKLADAFDVAIEALSAERTGEWIDKGEYAECSMCGAHSGTQFDGVEPIPLKTNYCPNCGARMKGESHDKRRSNTSVE